MVEKGDIIKIAGWVVTSSYRNRVMITLGNKLKTPSTIARESGIKLNHISRILKELKDKNLVCCINEEAHKGRLYQITDLGKEVMKSAKNIEG